MRAASPAHRIHGAYLELIDLRIDDGVEIPSVATPRQILGSGAAATELATETSESQLLQLVESAAYSADPPAEDAVEVAWYHSGELADRIRSNKTLQERAGLALSVRSLRRGGHS